MNDPIEEEYLKAIDSTYDNDIAHWLSVGLKEYRELYKWKIKD